MATENTSLFLKIKDLLKGLRLSVNDEKLLQGELETLFIYGIKRIIEDRSTLKREYPLEGAGRVDFFVTAGSAIEVKIKGSPKAIYRQLEKYSKNEEVKELILITSKTMTLPETINGKPAYCLNISQAWL